MVDKFHITEKTQEKLMLKLKNSLTKAERNGLISSPLISLILGVLTIIAILILVLLIGHEYSLGLGE